jgi:hypothetical protein
MSYVSPDDPDGGIARSASASAPDEPVPETSPRRGRRRAIGSIIGVAVVLAIVAAIVIARRSGEANVSLPPSIAGQTQLQGPAIDAARAKAEAALQRANSDGVIGWYGGSAVVRFVVLAQVTRQGPADPFLTGAQGTPVSGATIDESKETNWSAGVVRYECAPFTGLAAGSSTVSGTICFWNDDLTVGYVTVFDPSLDPRSTTVATHDAVVT